MKRILIIAILTIYSIASFGVNVNHFYCCGKLKGVSLVVNAEKKPTNCKSSAKGCCENKTVTLKLKTDQKSAQQSIFHFDAPFSPCIIHPYHYSIANIGTSGNAFQFYKKSNPPNTLSRNLFFCVFII